jgi:hypothetical protein
MRFDKREFLLPLPHLIKMKHSQERQKWFEISAM